MAVLGSQLTGLRFFRVIAFAGPARLIKPIRVQNQAGSGFSRLIASAINRAGYIIPAESLGTPKQPGSCNQALTEEVLLFHRNTIGFLNKIVLSKKS